MLSAYYSKGCDSRELFQGLKIYDTPEFEEKLGKYNVIKLDLNSEYQNTKNKANLIEIMTEDIKAEMREEFTQVALTDDDTLGRSLLKIYSATGQTFIIIIDEYDVLFREQVEEELCKQYGMNFSGTKDAVIKMLAGEEADVSVAGL